MLTRRLRLLLRRTHGSATLETALALIVGIPFCLYAFETCMLTYTEGVIADATRLGVRYAIVHGTDSSNCSGPSKGCADSTGTNVQNVVSNNAVISLHNMTGLVVTVSYPDGTSTPGSHVLVQSSYDYVPYFSMPGIAQTLQAQSEGVIVY
jgi:hypothetical protein